MELIENWDLWWGPGVTMLTGEGAPCDVSTLRGRRNIPAALLRIQLPSNGLRKAEDGSSAWATATHAEGSDKPPAPGSGLAQCWPF